MKTERKYYHLIKSVIVILFLSFGMTSCEKEDPVIVPTEQTVFMYLPWSTNLTSNFYQNISDLENVVGKNILKNERVIVFMCTTATKATLFELTYENGKSARKTLKEYTDPAYTTAEGITSILNDVHAILLPNVTQWLSAATVWDGYPYQTPNRVAVSVPRCTGSTKMYQ